MKKEIWKAVVGYDGDYEVSNIGRVRSIKKGKIIILKPWIDSVGYPSVSLWKNGKQWHVRVHRLVWEAFKYPIPEGMEIDHISTVRDDNRVENLRCVTHKENCNNENTKINRDKVMSTPEWRRKNADTLKKLWQDKDFRKKHAEAIKKRSQDPEWLKKNAEANKKKAKDPEWRRKTLEGVKKKYEDPEYKKIASDRLKKQMQDQEFRRKRAEGIKKRVKPINQYTLDGKFLKRWTGAGEIEAELGFYHSYIAGCCNGRYKQAYGFKWEHCKS